MNQMRNVVIVMSRCSWNKESFGIRFEEDNQGNWVSDWAFAVKEAVSKKEGYDKNEIKGAITLDAEYPGCPHCKNRSIVLCSSCGKVSCYDGSSLTVTCPWCGVRNGVGGSIQSLRGGNDY